MAKRIEERMDLVEQLHRLPIMDENLSLVATNIKEINTQIDKQQQQIVLKYIEGKNSATGKMTEGTTSQAKSSTVGISIIIDESKRMKMSEDDKPMDQSKFKKVEMPIFNGTDPDSWLFRADRYFKIHELIDSEKFTAAVISFDGLALDWYRLNDELEAFTSWENMKLRMLVRFRTIRDGLLVGKFLSIKQETTIEEYRNMFDRLLAPVTFLQIVVLEKMFMNGLSP